MTVSAINQINQLAAEQMNKFLSKRITPVILGGSFLNESQKKVAAKFLLNNDEFQRVAVELHSKTGAFLTIVPVSKSNPAVEIKIFEGKNLLDWFAKDTKGSLIFETLDPREAVTNNKYYLNNFFKKIGEYIKLNGISK